MAGLLYKDLILNRKNLLVVIIGEIFFAAIMLLPIPSELLEGGEMVYSLLIAPLGLIMFMITGATQQELFVIDEKKIWADFIVSTPLSVKGQVLSKYLFSLLMSVSTLAVCTLVYGLNSVIRGFGGGVIRVMPMIFVFQLYIRAIEFPFLIRFGSKYGNNIRTGIFFAIVFAAIVYGLFGDLSIFGTFDDFMEWFTALYSSVNISDVTRMLTVLVPIAAAVVYFLSYKISCRLYLRGTDNYDK